MGGDGGSIPTRDELVRTKKRGEQKDKDFDRLHRWSNCALTQEPLRRPIIACQLGRMYNKQTILEFLLESKSGNLNEDDLKFDPGIVRHIKGIKVGQIGRLERQIETSYQSCAGGDSTALRLRFC